MKTFKSFVTEAEDTVTRDKSGKVVSWEHKGDWKKTDNKNPIGKMYNMSDIARRRTEKMTKEEVEKIQIKEAKIEEIFKDGPPCLNRLARDGFGEGSRNNALFNIIFNLFL